MNRKICDMRGSLYSANYLEVINNKLYYCGFPVYDIVKADTYNSKYIYNILGAKGTFNLGTIALDEKSFEAAKLVIGYQLYIYLNYEH